MFRSIYIKDFRQFQDKEFYLGKYVTVLAGRNSTGKSTVLGLLANSSEMKKNVCETYTHGRFRAEFSEIIKGSKKFDKTGSGLFQITIDGDDSNRIICDFRTAWQKYNKEDVEANRFRLIPKWENPNGDIVESKLERPVIYLGLSRLFPIGESQKIGVKKLKIKFDNTDHEKWFFNNYTYILSINDSVESITNYSIGETDKKIGIGITTQNYDYLTNSSGQDNLGQILFSILSFKRAKEKLGSSWKGGLLLIDEVDATLHPVAQIRLLDLLMKEAKQSKFQVVFTTHSLSLLRKISERTELNGENPNQNVEVYYFTNANRRLDILRNPHYSTMENDLMIQSVVHNQHRIKVYSEDAEARWFLKNLIGDYQAYVDILDVQVGCQSLMSMYSGDIGYFSKMLIVLDGDVKRSTLEAVPKVIRERFNNILKLPGEKSPEEVLYDYLMALEPDHEFWERAKEYDISWQVLKDNGPNSDHYKKEKKREKYKAWFNDYVAIFDVTSLGEYWVRDNKTEAEKFLKEFMLAYNSVAKRTLSPIIKV